MFKIIQPMLATLVDKPFDDSAWVFETKWDGFRMLAQIKDGKVTLYSRNGEIVTDNYSSIVKDLEKIKHDVVIDGELVALDNKGRSRFQLLQNALRTKTNLFYYVFDIISLDGKDLRDMTLLERKEELKKIIPTGASVRFSEHRSTHGIKYFEEARNANEEGIMAKRADSNYQSGKRSHDWLKIKTGKRQEFVIVGFTKPRFFRKYFGSLLLAVRDGNAWRYVGNVGTGFDREELKNIHEKLLKIKRDTKPFEEKTKYDKTATWVKPELVCEVKFTEWTKDGELRHPAFVGLREDKVAHEVVKEMAMQEFTHLDKVMWPDDGYTKADLIEYYKNMAPVILPYLKDYPSSLYRTPEGIEGVHFYQKNVDPKGVPDFVTTKTIHTKTTDEDINYVVCNNEETLLYLANIGCIEMHPWSSRVDSLDKPDFMILDLDRGVDSTFEDVIIVAQAIHKLLDKINVPNFCKTSGKYGLHIYVPTGAKYSYEKVRDFANKIAEKINEELPEIVSLEHFPDKRKNKIHIDTSRNAIGQTVIAPYSLRSVSGAPVSAPLEWHEVKHGLKPDQFTIKNIFKRIKEKGDLWEGVDKEPMDLDKAERSL